MQTPEGFTDLTREELAVISNGCGPKKYGFLVPDTVWGLNITPA